MNAPVHTKTFKSGNSVAVRLPKGFAIAADTEVILEQRDGEVVLRPKRDKVKAKQELLQLIADLKAIGRPPGPPQEREQFDFPDRPGL